MTGMPQRQPRLTVTSVTLGSPDPRALAAFWARVLGTEVVTAEGPREGEPPEAGWAQLRAPGGPTLNLEYEQAWTRPVWPAERGRQHVTAHLDIEVDDLEDATAWALECGATLAPHQPQEHVRVLLDPSGHPFCLFT